MLDFPFEFFPWEKGKCCSSSTARSGNSPHCHPWHHRWWNQSSAGKGLNSAAAGTKRAVFEQWQEHQCSSELAWAKPPQLKLGNPPVGDSWVGIREEVSDKPQRLSSPPEAFYNSARLVVNFGTRKWGIPNAPTDKETGQNYCLGLCSFT